MICKICQQRETCDNDTVCYFCEELIWDARAEAWEQKKEMANREESWDDI